MMYEVPVELFDQLIHDFLVEDNKFCLASKIF